MGAHDTGKRVTIDNAERLDAEVVRLLAGKRNAR